MNNCRKILLGICLLTMLPGCGHKQALAYYEILRKLGRLTAECLTYARGHSGNYPSSLDVLVSTGQISQKTLENLLDIKDLEGPGKDRRWVYLPNDPDLLFFTTHAVTYEQVDDGKTTVERVWIVAYRGASVRLLTFDKLPSKVREKITPDAK